MKEALDGIFDEIKETVEGVAKNVLEETLAEAGYKITEEEREKMIKKMSIDLLTKLLKDQEEAKPLSMPEHAEVSRLSLVAKGYNKV